MIDPHRYPLLHGIASSARWAGQDEFPGSVGPDLFEKWLGFIASKGEFERFGSRLRTSNKEQRDETFAEIGCAFFIENTLGLPIVKWEPPGADATKGEFLAQLPDGRGMFVEVKSPGWEAEVIEDSRKFGDPTPPIRPDRLAQPKYTSGVEVFFYNSELPIETAVRKAYPKFPDSMPTLLLILDDARVPLLEMCRADVLGTMYERQIPGTRDPTDPTRFKRDGCFFDRRCERLGAIGILGYGYSANAGTLRFALFRNPHSLRATAVPVEAFAGREVHDGS